MAQLIVRKLHDHVKERLRARAKRHGRTLEGEARAILEKAANGRRAGKRPPRSSAKRQLKEEESFGTLMYERFKKTGLTEEEARQFQKGIDELNANWRMRVPKFEK